MAKKLNMQHLIHRALKKHEIAPTSPNITDSEWQDFRISLKGLSTEEKEKQLRTWLRKHPNSEKARIQVTNYVNALKRGGLAI